MLETKFRIHTEHFIITKGICFFGDPEGKRPLGRPRRRWVDNMKEYLREVRWNDVDWIDLAQDRDQLRALANTVMDFWVP
jgi:hypothetical protein